MPAQQLQALLVCFGPGGSAVARPARLLYMLQVQLVMRMQRVLL